MPDHSNLVLYGISFALILLIQGCWQRPSASDTGTVHPKATETEDTEPSRMIFPDTTAFSKSSENARIALLQPCGRCHQSSLDTHKPGAIAVFDLDAGERWHTNLSLERLNGLDRRTQGNNQLTEQEKLHIAEFIALKRPQMQ